MAIIDFDEFAREYDADNVFIHRGWEVYVHRTCKYMNWKWYDEGNTFVYIIAWLFGARKKTWFMRQCRRSRHGFYIAVENQVDFMKKVPK